MKTAEKFPKGVLKAAERIWADGDTFYLPTEKGVAKLAEVIDRETKSSALIEALEALLSAEKLDDGDPILERARASADAALKSAKGETA